jgi:hypothetical protein
MLIEEKHLEIFQKFLSTKVPPNAKYIIYLTIDYIHENLKNKKPPLPDQWKEIVQLCAIKFDHKNCNIIDVIDHRIYPQIYSKNLTKDDWNYFTLNTELGVEQVFRGGYFTDIINSFIRFAEDTPIIIMDDEQDIIYYNAKNYHATIPLLKYIKIKSMFDLANLEFKEITYNHLYLCLQKVPIQKDEYVKLECCIDEVYTNCLIMALFIDMWFTTNYKKYV